jgi:hypothetical protein
MAGELTEIIKLKLLLEDQDAIKNLKLTNEEVQKLKQSVSNIDDEFIKSFERIRSSLKGFNDPLTTQTLPGTVKLNMAVSQLGYAMNDASMFLVNFRMGLMGVANNIPMVISLMQAARVEIAATGGTMRAAMLSTLMGPGTLILAVNAFMIALQFLPDLLDSISNSADEVNKSMSEEERKIRTSRNEFNMLVGVLQDVNSEESIRKEALKQLKEHYPEYIKLQEADLSNNEKIAAALKKGNEQFELKIKLAASEQILKEYYDQVAAAEYEIQKLYEKREELQKQFDEGNKSRGFSLVAINEDIAEFERRKTEAIKKVEEFNIKVLQLESLIDDAPKKDKKNKSLDKPEIPELSIDKISWDEVFNKLGMEPDPKMLKDVLLVSEEEIERVRIRNIQDRFERERQLADFELKVAQDKYSTMIGGEAMLTQVIEEHKNKRNEIAREEAEFKVSSALRTLSVLQSAFAEHTAIAKAASIASTIIQTYQAATAALSPPPIGVGPLFGPILAAATITAGFANVSKIATTDVPGYAEGGLLRKGRAGFIEGYHNEIIAPEKTFIEHMNTSIIPQLVIPSFRNSDNKLDEFIKEMRGWQRDLTFTQRGMDLVATTEKNKRTISELEY